MKTYLDRLVGLVGLSRICLTAIALLSAGAANAIVIADLEDLTNGGGFFATVTFEDTIDGWVKVTADIADPINMGLTQGDILELGMNLADDSLLGSLAFGTMLQTPEGIIGSDCQVANSCDLFTGGNGDPGLGFDITVEVGVNGSAGGFIETLMFDIIGGGITASMFAEQLVGMRVQSITGISGYMEGSSKLVGDGPGNGTPMPEPGTLGLLMIGFIGTGAARLRKKKQAV
jgi:hypothetical protein